ncbi:MAG: ABC transporter substrate-binding protein, partial [Nitrosopumilus sp.]|nr:ABC transporter substrate-binding protein [Nitrosopumilus sp.]
EAKNSDSILYFLTNSQGEKILSDTQKVEEANTVIEILPKDTKKLGIGTNNIKIFAISNSVLKPDFYESSFIVTDSALELPVSSNDNIEFSKNNPEYWIWVLPIVIILGIATYLKKRN